MILKSLLVNQGVYWAISVPNLAVHDHSGTTPWFWFWLAVALVGSIVAGVTYIAKAG